jgi:hypothetical protein
MFYNVLAYADDIVLIAPSWMALQKLTDCLSVHAQTIDMQCNVVKTVCMIFQPVNKYKRVSADFPCFSIEGKPLPFVTEFKYLGHTVNNCFNDDDDDVKREIRNLFMRTNVLIRRFSKCSVNVKLRLFQSYCMCFYGAGLWKKFAVGIMNVHATINVLKCFLL